MECAGTVSLPGRADGTHPDEGKGDSQKARMFALLKDRQWHDVLEIHRVVYGGYHLGAANHKARINEIKNDGYEIESRKKAGTIWEYRIVEEGIKEIAKNLASG